MLAGALSDIPLVLITRANETPCIQLLSVIFSYTDMNASIMSKKIYCLSPLKEVACNDTGFHSFAFWAFDGV